ncbi:hypothetical protein R3P38DRAFT_3445570 [Favolaschia claudopus]|uniref:Uncharacterized protein n=1 Tax=Favolaschia claudopus TaxID=2862362 RepID=A0AAV9ZPG8_9AGAR
MAHAANGDQEPTENSERLLLLPQKISCHLRIDQTGLPPVFQTFYGIPVPPGRLTLRHNVLSITVAGLLSDLRRWSCDPSFRANHSLVRDFITGDAGSQITLFTTRTLDFGPGMEWQTPSAVFRQLMSLNEAEERMSLGDIFPPAGEFQGTLEVLAASPPSSKAATEFFESWKPTGVYPESCFILLVTIPDPLIALFDDISSNSGSDSLRSSPHPSLSSQLLHNGAGNVVLYGNDPDALFREFPMAQSSFGTFEAPIGNPGFGVEEPHEPPVPPRPFRRGRSPSMCTAYESLSRVAQKDGLVRLLRDAQFTTNTTLKCKISQYHSMDRLLETLGFDGPVVDPELPQQLRSSVSIQLSYKHVVRACDWRFHTFINKSRLYSALKTVTERSWKGTSPGEDDADFETYQIWLGAKYLLSLPALANELEPNPHSSDEFEKAAASLVHEQMLKKIGTAAFRDKYTVSDELH